MKAKYILTDIRRFSGKLVAGGYCCIGGRAVYDFERTVFYGKVRQRTCGYGLGCFWSDWQ